MAMWIWYPGDFEIWLGNMFNNRRTERGAMFPPFWKQCSHYVTVEFSREYNLKEAEEIRIICEGKFNFMLDGKLQYGEPETFIIHAGVHKLNIKVWNQSTPPALYIEGNQINTDSSWLATYEDKIWIDENGIAHGSGIYKPAATSPYFQSPEELPSEFKLDTRPVMPVSYEDIEGGRLYDFGKEMMAKVSMDNVKFTGDVDVYYGESREEALDHARCETLDKVHVTPHQNVRLGSKAFRYVHIAFSNVKGNTHGTAVYAHYEYQSFDPLKSGSFRCNDEELNKIWDVSAYTMDLTTREFFLDGIKRDRWTWSGDAVQSYLMNYYLRYDVECVKRTIRQLRGKDPVTAHINTIMDYTFYWFISVYDYYKFTGDISFVREMYPRMVTLMDYCLSRTVPAKADVDGKYAGKDVIGMAEGQPDDWIFVDWVDFPMHKRGIMAFEQILFARSLDAMCVCAELLRDTPYPNPPQGSISDKEYAADAERYKALRDRLVERIDKVFWDDEKKAYIHSVEDGVVNEMVTKFPNMFAIISHFASAERQKDITDSVMLNPGIEPITTPYMRFYELDAMCMMGQHDTVLSEMKSYWGGMIREGATSFWEKYIPSEHGTQHLAMYGRPYGKSLCHAWGASPIYIIGKHFLGVKPLSPGYEEYEVRPHLSTLEWMEGTVPTPMGLIRIKMTPGKITVHSPGGKCHVIPPSEEYEVEVMGK